MHLLKEHTLIARHLQSARAATPHLPLWVDSQLTSRQEVWPIHLGAWVCLGHLRLHPARAAAEDLGFSLPVCMAARVRVEVTGEGAEDRACTLTEGTL